MANSVVITGGNRGIWRSLREGFVKAGYNVVVGARQNLGVDHCLYRSMSRMKQI